MIPIHISSVENIPIKEIKQEKCIHSLTNFVNRRKMTKNILTIIKNNIENQSQSLSISFKNLLEILSKILSKSTIQQLQIFLEISQTISQIHYSSPNISCIKAGVNLLRIFDINYITNILWMSFRSSIYYEYNDIEIVRICSNQHDCINPFHWSLLSNILLLDPNVEISHQKICLLNNIQCNVKIDEESKQTKIITPSISSLSSIFLIYYSQQNSESSWKELGICIYHSYNYSVALYNFSNQSIFISSISIEIQNQKFNKSDPNIPVYKVLPNHSINMFSSDFLKSIKTSNLSIPILNSGILTVQISFGKGWGRGYSRSSFLYCPRRCEISIKLPDFS